MARAVVGQLEAALPATTVRRADVWLLRAPQGVHACVWEVVCAAALEAMWYGKRRMWAVHCARPRPGGAQPLITQFFQVVAGAPPPPSAPAGALAAARFWEFLADLAALGWCPASVRWKEVPPDHPFLGVEVLPGTPERRRLIVRLPGGPAAPAAGVTGGGST